MLTTVQTYAYFSTKANDANYQTTKEIGTGEKQFISKELPARFQEQRAELISFHQPCADRRKK
jgi:hypothetical protein